VTFDVSTHILLEPLLDFSSDLITSGMYLALKMIP